MFNLLKIELFKIRKGKEKYIIILSFIFMLISPIVSTFLSESSYDKDFISNIYRFFEYNFEILFPLSIGIFTICVICNEFKNKSIKFYLMSEYNKSEIFLSKFLAINIFVIMCFIITYIIYSIIGYVISGKMPIIINYKAISISNLIFDLILLAVVTILYIIVIIAFSSMLAYITKKQSVSVLLFIIINSLMLLMFGGIYELSVIPRYSFFYASELYSIIWDFNDIHLILRYILPCISNTFLFLTISLIAFDKYQYN